MNLRLPIVGAIVGIAAAAAAVRGFRPSPAVPALSLATARPVQPAPPAAAPKATIVVYVAGEVARSGVYTLSAGARAVDALRAAGGAAAGADLVAVNLAAPLADGEEVAIRSKDAPPASAGRSRLRATGGTSGSRAPGKKRHRKRAAKRDAGAETAAEPPTELVDLNAADESALETLPGVGPALAERILIVRDQSGPFGSLDDLLDVAGITQTKLDEIEPFVTLH